MELSCHLESKKKVERFSRCNGIGVNGIEKFQGGIRSLTFKKVELS